MVQSNRDKIQELQTELLQDFFEIQMTEQFSPWQTEVKTVASAKEGGPHSTYKNMMNVFNTKAISDVTVKDFDVTALAALMKFDFPNVCCINHNVRECITKITNDRNEFSHIANYRDTQRVLSLERTAINSMRDFLDCLKMSNWSYRQRESFYRKYTGTGSNDGLINEIQSSVNEESNDETRYKECILRYLEDRRSLREEKKLRYVGLSYNLDGHESEAKTLDQLISTNIENSPIGMRVVAEGGYGKTWTLSEIAGLYAEHYLIRQQDEEKPIPILISLGMLNSGCSTITKRIAQMFFEGNAEKAQKFLGSNKIILLIDAMDEAEPSIQSDISREIASLKDMYSEIIFICASRKSCIEKYPISIPCYEIKQMNDEQIVEYMSKCIPGDAENRDELLEKARGDWTGDKKKQFLNNNRTPFYLNCYMKLLCETGDNDLVDTTQLVEKFLNAIIDREIKKTGFNSDRMTFINFLIEFCRLLDAGNGEGEKELALPFNNVIRELKEKVVVEEGKASVATVCRKLIEILILALDEGTMLSFSHLNYREYINRKYPRIKYRSW